MNWVNVEHQTLPMSREKMNKSSRSRVERRRNSLLSSVVAFLPGSDPWGGFRQEAVGVFASFRAASLEAEGEGVTLGTGVESTNDLHEVKRNPWRVAKPRNRTKETRQLF